MGEGRVSLGTALSDERARRATVQELLVAQRGCGQIKASRVCRRAGINPTKRVEDLVIEERRKLLESASS